jgi:hypothetical protein
MDATNYTVLTDVLEGGKQYAEFTLYDGGRDTACTYVGVVAGGVSAQAEDAQEHKGNCFYCAVNGRRYHKDIGGAVGGEKWEGMTDARADGDRIGMLLDQDEGSLTVYKNDRRCGVMLSSGLAGNFRWAASLQSKPEAVRIEAKPVPE